MDADQDQQQDYRAARRRVRLLRSFYIHLIVFCGVMTLLLVINLATSPVWWVQWPFIGWGIGLTAHAISVFGLGGWLGPEWEERKIRELMAKK